jgi:curved DNA-binding protein CbpA
MTTTTTNYYALFGVESDATTAQIKSAYLKRLSNTTRT